MHGSLPANKTPWIQYVHFIYRVVSDRKHSLLGLARTMSIHRICRVGQNHAYTPYMTVYSVISMPKIPYIHRNHEYTSDMTVYSVISMPRIPYIHRTWPYIQWFPCQIYLIYTIYVYRGLLGLARTITYTVYDHTFGDSLPMIPHIHHIYLYTVTINIRF